MTLTASSTGLQNKILVSRLLTRSGDQAWDFAVPVTLITLFPAHISLIALIYFLTKLGSVIFQPWLSSFIDHWMRLKTAACGALLQLSGIATVVLSVFQLTAKAVTHDSLWLQPQLWPWFAATVAGSLLSTLGAGLMDVSVGNDWIPAAVPQHRLAVINTRLQRLDLLTEVLSPVIAGLILSASAAGGPLTGFTTIALWNALSFIPEILLLRNVFLSSPQLQTKTLIPSEGPRGGLISQTLAGWSEFRTQTAALPVIAYTCLWLSALSPHGVLLTSFLKTGWNFTESSLGIFRGLGAVFGLLATLLFPRVRKIFGLVGGSRFFITFQALVLLVSLPFFFRETGGGWVFLALILASRIGLYGFSLGETEIRQRTIPEGVRGKVNGVAGALTSFATLVLFGLGSLLGTPKTFPVLVVSSVAAVTAGALLFYRWSVRAEPVE
jgi:iron-regulated transporter 1